MNVGLEPLTACSVASSHPSHVQAGSRGRTPSGSPRAQSAAGALSCSLSQPGPAPSSSRPPSVLASGAAKPTTPPRFARLMQSVEALGLQLVDAAVAGQLGSGAIAPANIAALKESSMLGARCAVSGMVGRPPSIPTASSSSGEGRAGPVPPSEPATAAGENPAGAEPAAEEAAAPAVPSPGPDSSEAKLLQPGTPDQRKARNACSAVAAASAESGRASPALRNISLSDIGAPSAGAGASAGGGGRPQSSLAAAAVARPFKRRSWVHPLAAFQPTRGHAMLVFNEVDIDRSGKLTRSEVEEAAGLLGFTVDKANSLFDRRVNTSCWKANGC